MNEAQRNVEQTLKYGKMVTQVWLFYLAPTNIIITASSLYDIHKLWIKQYAIIKSNY